MVRTLSAQIMARRIAAGFGLALLVIVAMGWGSARAVDALQDTAGWVRHTQMVIDAIHALMSDVRDAETGQRGYLLTHEDKYLEPYIRARADLSTIKSKLLDLTSDNAEQQTRLRKMFDVSAQKLNELATTVDLEKQGKHPEAMAVVKSDIGRQYMVDIQSMATEVVAHENSLLAQRQLNNADTAANARALFLWGTLGLVLFMGIAGFFIVRSITGPVGILVSGAQALGSGDYAQRVDVPGDDELKRLADAFNTMATRLGETARKSREEEWLQTKRAELAYALQGQPNHEAAARAFLDGLAPALGAAQGAVFSRDASRGDKFRFTAGYAFSGEPPEFAEGETALGQAVKARAISTIADVPESYFRVSSALGSAAPRALVIAPAIFQNESNAVVELGLMHPLSEAQMRLLRESSNLYAVVHNAITAKLATETLLEEQRVLTEEMQNQQAELEQQQQALELSNSSLATQTRSLKDSERLMQQKNRALEEVQKTLESRAQELAQSSAYKSEFLANMSHELRTPLNSLLLLSGLLGENKNGNLTDKQVEYAKVIHSSGRDLLGLIDQVLDLARIEAGRIDLHLETIPLGRLATGLTDTFGVMADQKNIKFNVSVAPGLPDHITTDSQRLQQTIRNLVANAIKFTEKGSVSVRIERPREDEVLPRPDLVAHSALVLRVEDTGIGIDSANLRRVFEAFTQADGSTSRRFGGTGLGLTISRQLAQLMGGDITVASEVGTGSTFSLYIPDRAPEVASRAPPPRARVPMLPPALVAPPPASADRTLLIVEDDVAFANAVTDLATERKFRVVHTTRGKEAVALAKREHPVAILLDIRLPDTSGIEVLAELKRTPETQGIPVHAFSAYDYETGAIAAGASSHFRKPIDSDVIEKIFAQLSMVSGAHRVLVIEDDERQRMAMTEQVESQGMQVEGAGSAREALAKIEIAGDANRFHVAILDIGLPDESGFELLEKLAARQVPSIVYTGRALTQTEETKLRKHAYALIIKDKESPGRLRDELSLFFHKVERSLPELDTPELTGDSLTDKKVLIVDDDVRNIFALTSLLESHGAKTIFAENGKQALEMLDAQSVDLVLMDVMMPEMDGYEAIRRIRAQAKFARLPIISVTAKAMRGDREKSIEAGASDYVTKPIDVDRLLYLLRVWLQA